MILTLHVELSHPDPSIADQIIQIVRSLPGVVEVDGSVTELTADPIWRVEDNVTRMRATRNFEGREIAEHMCAQLNDVNSGGRYVVMINRLDGKGWMRDVGVGADAGS